MPRAGRERAATSRGVRVGDRTVDRGSGDDWLDQRGGDVPTSRLHSRSSGGKMRSNYYKTLRAANPNKPFLKRNSHPYNRSMVSLPLDSSRIVVMIQP